MTHIEQRPLYGIGTVARLSGIKPDTLRIWERRYGLGASAKADNGRRLYTQTDLEHLQIIARLVRQGFRIGEIADLEGKTLAAMLDQSGANFESLPQRPRALFLGDGLCAWLDRHPGCLSGLDSMLLRRSVDSTLDEIELGVESVQLLVVETPALSGEQAKQLLALKKHLGSVACALFYEFASKQMLRQLSEQGIAYYKLPLQIENFASALKRLKGSLELERGVNDPGELASPQPRLFQDSDLVELLHAQSLLDCGCSQHLSEVIQSLVAFEHYSSQCSVENWHDAATHTCVYAYTNQARWLMEKALNAVLEEHAVHAKTTAV